MYDIIGDIHGHADELKNLLEKLGYRKKSGVYRHQERTVIFVGDFIDRGNKIMETLEIVKAMTDNGSAYAVMGNHEFNFLCYNVKLPDGTFLRPHIEKNDFQVEKTVNQFKGNEKQLKEYLNWFKTLPLFLDLGGLRICHACWDDENIKILKENNIEMTDQFLIDIYNDRQSRLFIAVDETLKGKEIELPGNLHFYDRYGIKRTKMRIWWCLNPEVCTYGEYFTELIEEIKDEKVDMSLLKYKSYYKEHNPPVFFGHYWLRSEKPIIKTDNAVCVDFSIAKENGILTAYRWDGENKVSNEKFCYVYKRKKTCKC